MHLCIYVPGEDHLAIFDISRRVCLGDALARQGDHDAKCLIVFVDMLAQLVLVSLKQFVILHIPRKCGHLFRTHVVKVFETLLDEVLKGTVNEGGAAMFT